MTPSNRANIVEEIQQLSKWLREAPNRQGWLSCSGHGATEATMAGFRVGADEATAEGGGRALIVPRDWEQQGVLTELQIQQLLLFDIHKVKPARLFYHRGHHYCPCASRRMPCCCCSMNGRYLQSSTCRSESPAAMTITAPSTTTTMATAPSCALSRRRAHPQAHISGLQLCFAHFILLGPGSAQAAVTSPILDSRRAIGSRAAFARAPS